MAEGRDADRPMPRRAVAGPAPAAADKAAPWRQLHEHARAQGARVLAASGLAPAPQGDGLPPLRSAQRFHELWQRIRTEDEIRDAVARGPENAGPLNSHRLVLRALALMQQLSPDYLRHFVTHADTLMWLDRAQDPLRRGGATAPPGRRTARGRK